MYGLPKFRCFATRVVRGELICSFARNGQKSPATEWDPSKSGLFSEKKSKTGLKKSKKPKMAKKYPATEQGPSKSGLFLKKRQKRTLKKAKKTEKFEIFRYFRGVGQKGVKKGGSTIRKSRFSHFLVIFLLYLPFIFRPIFALFDLGPKKWPFSEIDVFRTPSDL